METKDNDKDEELYASYNKKSIEAKSGSSERPPTVQPKSKKD